jgi:hypothetical protein
MSSDECVTYVSDSPDFGLRAPGGFHKDVVCAFRRTSEVRLKPDTTSSEKKPDTTSFEKLH